MCHWYAMLLHFLNRDVFETLPKICDGALLQK